MGKKGMAWAMRSDPLRYDRLVEDALRGVVRAALGVVARQGLPGAHHFYITFRTHQRGVDIPEYLRAQFPGEMTIVLQHQFWALEVEEESFAVVLSFNNIRERLSVPFAAVTAFADPHANFALQFQPPPAERPTLAVVDEGAEGGGKMGPVQAAKSARPRKPKPTSSPGPEAAPVAGPKDKPEAKEEKRGEVVALDAFRKK